MDDPEVPGALRRVTLDGVALDKAEVSYFLGRETLLPRRDIPSGMAFWRERLFALMARNARDATAFFRIPPDRVVELGTQVEI